MHYYRKKIETEEMEQLPAYLYEDEVLVIEKEQQVEQAIADLMDSPVVGFDTETRPSFKKGVTHQVGLLQVASEKRVYLFRLNKYGLIAPLRQLLSDEKILKVGVGIRDDIRALRRLSDFEPAAFLDLQLFARSFGIEEMSFSKLMAIIFEVRVSKKQRTSNWEVPRFTHAQIKYAATDAWGSLKMYQALRDPGHQVRL